MPPDFERADRIGEFWGNPKSRSRSVPMTKPKADVGIPMHMYLAPSDIP